MVVDGVLATKNDLNEKAFSSYDYSIGPWPETKEIRQSTTLIEQHVQSLLDAVKAGSLVEIQFLVESHGLDLLSRTDDEGLTAAHWTCLRGHRDVLSYIIDMNGPVNEPSGDEIGQRPIHSACANGHTSLIAMLLKHGVSIEVIDNKGCTPLIVASQHGQTLLVGYLVGMGACQYSSDKEGDTALHWAAFRGHDETMRLLIYLGCNPSQRDSYLQTPLHLACISGHLSTVRGLCEQENVEINPADKNGKTPNMLAAGRKHGKIVEYLKNQSKQRRGFLPRVDLRSVICGSTGNTKVPLLFIVALLLCWAYPMYIIKCIPMTWDDLQLVHVVFIGLNSFMWFSLYVASTSDPGYLPRNILQYDLVLQQVASGDSWNEVTNPLSRLCHTCHTVKPLRSKHCRCCDRCVAVFDHHCPFVYNCVGLGNRVWFVSFISSAFLVCLMASFFGIYMLGLKLDLMVLLGLIELIIIAVLCFFLLGFAFYHAAVNLTTNEHMNFRRYTYLKDSNGIFRNPFDRGLRRNFLEFIHLQQPLTEDETGTLNTAIV